MGVALEAWFSGCGTRGVVIIPRVVVAMEAVRQLVLSAFTASSSRRREVLRGLLTAVEEKRERDMMDVAPVSYGYGVLQVYQGRQ